MTTNQNDRIGHRYRKDAAVSIHKKSKLPNPLKLKTHSDSLKAKQETLTTSRLTNKHENCFPPPQTPWKFIKPPKKTFKTTSISLVDLLHEDKTQPNTWTHRKPVSREQVDDVKPTSLVEERINSTLKSHYIFNFTSDRESELAKFVCRKFIVNAWRKRIAQKSSLQLMTKSLNEEMKNISMQTNFLNSLNESEKERIDILAVKLNLTKSQLKEEQQKTTELNEQINRRKVLFSEEEVLWHSRRTQKEKIIKSLQSELDLAVKNSLELTEKAEHCKKQLDDSKKNMDSLKAKLEVSEASVKDKMNDFNILKNKCLDLQMTIEGLVTRNQEVAREKEMKESQIRDYKSNLENVEVNLKNILDVHCSDFDKLINDYEAVKTQVINKDLEIGFLRETIKLYRSEESALKNKLKTAVLRVFQMSWSLPPLSGYNPF